MSLRRTAETPLAGLCYANPETEKVGQIVLTNQFISGLQPTREEGRRIGPRRCLNCGLEGHVARMKGLQEAHGHHGSTI